MDERATTCNKDRLFEHLQSRLTNRFIITSLLLDIGISDDNYNLLYTELQQISNEIKTFTDLDEYTDFITDVEDRKVLLIVSPPIIRTTLSIIQYVPQLYSIYIFSTETNDIEQRVFEQNKVKGLFTQIESICIGIKRDLCQLINEQLPFSIVSVGSSSNWDQLDQSFMYTTLLKEAILELRNDRNAHDRFTRYCLDKIIDEPPLPERIYEFQRCYTDHSPIWWYTKEYFVYFQLNRALRTQDTEFMIEMGFFLRDLHLDIVRKHITVDKSKNLTVYRGQGISTADFHTIKQRKGSLLSFNCFLSASFDKRVAKMFAESNSQNKNMVGIIFRIEINPKSCNSPYAIIEGISAFQEENEVLFAMQAIFRVGEVNEIDDKLWEVNIKLTNENDADLTALTNFIRSELEGYPGWYRIAHLITRMGEYEKALEIFDTLCKAELHKVTVGKNWLMADMETKVVMTQHLLGRQPCQLKQLENLEEKLKSKLSPDDPLFHKIYFTEGVIYQTLGDYKTSLSYLERALQIIKRQTEPSYASLIAVQNMIALVQYYSNDLVSAFKTCEEIFLIAREYLSKYHPSLAQTYNNMGLLYQSNGNNVTAIASYEKALEILQRSVPPKHPDIGMTKGNIGVLFATVGNYQSAQQNFAEALRICQTTLPEDHYIVGNLCSSIGGLNVTTGNYINGLAQLEKAHIILQRYLPDDHHLLLMNVFNIGTAYACIKDYSKALIHYEKVLATQEKSNTLNSGNFILLLCSMSTVCHYIGELSKAKSYLGKALEIGQKCLPANHPALAKLYLTLSLFTSVTGEFLSGAYYHKKCLDIEQALNSGYQNDSSLAIHGDQNDKFMKLISFGHDANCNSSRAFAKIFNKLGSLCQLGGHINEHDAQLCLELLDNGLQSITRSETFLQVFGDYLRTSPSVVMGRCIDINKEREFIQIEMKFLKEAARLIGEIKSMLSKDFEECGTYMFDTDRILEMFQQILSRFFEKHEKILRLYFGSDTPLLAAFYNKAGDQFSSAGSHSDAQTAYGRALEHILKNRPNDHELLATTYSNIAKEMDHLENYFDALDFSEKAVEVAESAFGSQHDSTEFYRKQLQQLREKVSLVCESSF